MAGLGSSIVAGRGYVSIDADLNPLQKTLGRIESAFKSIGNAASGATAKISAVGAKMSSIGSSIAGIGAGATLAGGGLFAGLAVPSTYAASIETAQTAFEILTGSATKAEQVINALRTKAANTPLEFAGIAQATQTLLAFGIGANDAVKAMDFLGDVSLGNQEKLDRLSLAFGQVAAKGRLMGGEVLQFTENGFNPLQEIARTTGRSMADLAKDMENGAISFDMVKKAFESATGPGGRFFNAMNKQAKTTTGAITKFRDSVMIALEPIGTALNKVVKVFAVLGSSAADAIAPIISRYKEVGVVVAGVAAALVVGGTLLAGIGASLVAVGTVISSIGAIIGGVVTAFGLIASAIAAVISPVGLLIAAVVGLGAYVAFSALSATGSLAKLSEMFGSLGKTAVVAWQGIAAAVSSGDLETAGAIAFGALELGWLTLTTKMQEVWAQVSAFIQNTWLSAVESIVQAGGNIYFTIADYADKIGDAFVQSFEIAKVAILDVIGEIVQRLRDAITYAQKATGFISEETANAQYATSKQEKESASKQRNNALGKQLVDSGAQLDKRAKQRRSDAAQFKGIVAEDFKRREVQVDKGPIEESQKRLDALFESLATKSKAAVDAAAVAELPPPPPEPAEQPKRTRREQEAFERQLDRDQKMENRQARFDTKAYKQAERFQNNHPEQFARAQAAQQAASSITSESGGSVGSFVSGVANSITGGGVATAMQDIASEQLGVLQSMDGRLREALTGEDGV